MGSEGIDMGKRAETRSEGDGTDHKHRPTSGQTRAASAGAAAAVVPALWMGLSKFSIAGEQTGLRSSRSLGCARLSARKEEREETAGRPTEETKMESTVETIESNEESNALPSLEEITSWTQGFDKVMRTEAGRNIFREFLRSEYSEENMLFWLACEDFKKEKNSKAVAERARTIYEDYISILSPREVSLDSRVREIVNRNLLNPCPLMFEDAQLQIYSLMHRDSFPRFLNSEMYKSLIEKPKTSPDTSPDAES